MNTNRLWLSLLAFFLMTTLSAQTITGVVLDDESKEPLLGANVLVKGTNIGSSSYIKANYILKTTQKNGTLVVSFVSFQTKEVPFTIVNGKQR